MDTQTCYCKASLQLTLYVGWNTFVSESVSPH